MSKIDELKQVYLDAWCAAEGDAISAGIAAVVRAVRDEFGRIMYPGDDWNRQGVLEQFDQILGDAGDEVAHICDGDEGPSLHQTPATDPAPAPCLWRVHHETRNGPLYVSQCDGEWRHATADPKCPSCKKEIFFVTDPAPAARSDATAVCEWRVVHSSFGQSFFASGCFKQHDNIFGGICPSCGKPIKFTEAQR